MKLMKTFYQKRESESWSEYYRRCPNACHVEWIDTDFYYYEKLVLESYLRSVGFLTLASYVRCAVARFDRIDDEWEITHCNF